MIFSWLKARFTHRGKAVAIYKKGLAKASREDNSGAIKAFTQVIELRFAPKDIASMALFNRGLVLVASGEKTKGVVDLELVLEMENSPSNVRTMARQELARIKSCDQPT